MKKTSFFKSALFRATACSFAVLFSGIPSRVSAAEFYFEKDRSLPLVYVTAAFRGGSAQDPESKSGATHLMGRLMLRGTKNKTKQQIDLALDQMGASIDFETRAEFCAFRGVVLSENLPSFLDLMQEILTQPSFRMQELEKLRAEEVSKLMNELNQDRSLVRLRFEEVFFKGHPYAKPNTGKIKDLQTLSASDLQKHYQNLIQSKNLIVLAAGDSNESTFASFLRGIADKRGSDAHIQPVPEFKTPPNRLRVVIFDKPDRTQTQVLIGQKGISFNSKDLDALQIGNHAFGGAGFQARLMIELRVKRGWTYGAGSSFKLGSSPHSWKIGFFPKNSDTPPAIREALKMIRDLQKNGLTEAEFKASKQSIVNGAGFAYNTPAKRMENRLTEVVFGLPEGYFKDYAERIERISREEVNEALARFVSPENLMIGLVATASLSKAAIAKELGIPEKDIEVQSYQKE
jgi:zinc protease